MPEHPSSTSSEQEFFRFPKQELERRWLGTSSQRRQKTVCVIGAGIAGLTAAYELVVAGHKVVVVEADRRSGGRISTWHVGDVSGEFGPMRIPPNHLGTLHYVRDLPDGRLAEGVFVQQNPAGWYRIRNQKERIANWRNLVPAFGGDPHYLFPGLPFDKTTSDPDQLMQQVFQNAKNPLDPGELWSIFNGSLGPVGRALGSMSLWQVCQGMLADMAGWGGAWAGSLPGAPLRPAAEPLRWFSDMGWEFVGKATGYKWEERVSALEACIEDIAVLGRRRIRLTDGMDALPLRLEAILRRKGVQILFGLMVTRVVSEGADDRVTVFVGNDEIAPESKFQYVICAVPASATARIEFNPRLSEDKRDALMGLPYQSAAKSLVLVKSRRWEKTDDIFGGASYTDLPIQQCWYPSDNARPIGLAEDDEGILVAMRAQDIGSGPQWELSPGAFGPADPDGWRRPAILTGSYMTGINAERFTSLSETERTDQVIRCLEQIHPGIADDVDAVKHCAWIEELTPHGGAWAYLGPGDHQRYQSLLCEPHPRSAPRIFFAGEHLCVLHGWMQSAIQSSLEAVMAVLDAP